MQDNLKQSKNLWNLLQNGQKLIAKMQTKTRQNGPKQIAKMQNLSQTKQNSFWIAKMQKIFQNEIEKIKKEINLLRYKLEQSIKLEANCKNAKPIARWTRANCRNENN